MSKLEIRLTEAGSFRSGDEIKGSVSWDFENSPESIFVRLFWYTSGKGSRDVGIEKEIKFDRPDPRETRSFSFKAPSSPYSFSGRLISIIWAIEALAPDTGDTSLIEFEISPTGREISLDLCET